MITKQFLHIGCGPKIISKDLPAYFRSPEWKEIRLDIDPQNEPDIVASMLDMHVVPDSSFDAVYSSHNIEHLYAHEVPIMLSEVRRVLKADGFFVVTCPDLQEVCRYVADDKLMPPLYNSSSGPISPIDILYGHRGYIQSGNLFMAHKTGFTMTSLLDALGKAQFMVASYKRVKLALSLWVCASKEFTSTETLEALAKEIFPKI